MEDVGGVEGISSRFFNVVLLSCIFAFYQYLYCLGGQAGESDGDAVEKNLVVSSEPQKPGKGLVDGITGVSGG